MSSICKPQPMVLMPSESSEFSSPPAEKATKRMRALDTLRGIAALSVTALHLSFSLPPVCTHPLHLCVDFFLVLSGFVLSHTYTFSDKAISAYQFIGYRFARIWPLMAFTSMMTFLVRWLVLSHELSYPLPEELAGVAEEVGMLNGLGLPFFPESMNNRPSWTASCEFWLSIPFAFLVTPNTPAVILLLCSMTCQAYLYNSVGSLSTMGGFVGLVRCASSFLLGASCYSLYRQCLPWWSERLGVLKSTGLEVALSIVVLGYFGEARDYASYHDFAGPWLFTIVVVVFALEGGMLSQALGKLDLLGLISYSIYLDHRAVLLFMWPTAPYSFSMGVARVVNGNHFRALVLFWMLLLPTAYVTYHCVEHPALKLIRKAVDRWLPSNQFAKWEGQYLNRGKIQTDKFYSIHGSVGQLTLAGPKVVRMDFQGEHCRGELREGGNVHWSDGDVWMRAREESSGLWSWCSDPKMLVRV